MLSADNKILQVTSVDAERTVLELDGYHNYVTRMVKLTGSNCGSFIKNIFTCESLVNNDQSLLRSFIYYVCLCFANKNPTIK